jgi:hypothetical protein
MPSHITGVRGAIVLLYQRLYWDALIYEDINCKMLSAEIDWNTMDASIFYGMLRTEDDAFKLAERLGLLYQEVRCDCGHPMTRQTCTKAKHGILFACTNLRSVCRKTKSILEGSWFSESRLTMQQGFFAICAYAANMDCSQFAFL